MFINRYLLVFMKHVKKEIIGVCFLDWVMILLDTIGAICSSFIVEYIISGKKHEKIIELFIIIGLCMGLKFIVNKYKIIKANKSSANIKTNLRIKLMNKIMDMGPEYINSVRTGDITDTLSNKVEWLSYYYTLYLPTVTSALINATIIIIVLAFMDIYTSAVCLIATILMSLCPMIFYHLMKDRGQEEWDAHTKYYSDCLDSIQGMTTLKAFGANKKREIQIREGGEYLRKCVIKHLKISMIENGLLELFARIGSALSVAVAVIHGYKTVDDSMYLILILFLAGACFTPMMNLVNAWHMGYRGITASYSISELLNEQRNTYSQVQEEKLLDVRKPQNEIEYEDITFAYEEENVISNINLDIKKGEMTAIVGESGSGKSTLISLLAGFYKIKNGKLRIKGASRNNISYVWQNPHIFYGTVKENILLGKPDATMEEVIDAAKKANIHEHIMSLPDGYETMVGENGDLFSGGEKQRIAIARAFLKKSDIIVLDEATSSLDRKNECEIQESIRRLCKGKTSLVIAHRLSTIKDSDKICVMENGKITAFGKHDELLKQSKKYKSLVEGA